MLEFYEVEQQNENLKSVGCIYVSPFKCNSFGVYH